jgi:hypothetical protein
MKSYAGNKTAPIQDIYRRKSCAKSSTTQIQHINRRKDHAGSKTARNQNIKRRQNAGCVGRDNMTYVTSTLKKHVQKIAD